MLCVKKKISILLISMLLLLPLNMHVSATGLNEIESNSSVSNEVQPSVTYSSEGQDIADQWRAVQDASKVRPEDLEKAAVIATPITRAIRIFIAFVELILLGIFGGVTAIDILCLNLSPLRKCLENGSSGDSAGGMGGFGGMPQPNAGSNDGLAAKISSWASKACCDSINACKSSGGGAGGNPWGAPQDNASPSRKNLLITYAKKRPVEIVLTLVCFILLTGTVFTDLGVVLSVKLTALLRGFIGGI